MGKGSICKTFRDSHQRDAVGRAPAAGHGWDMPVISALKRRCEKEQSSRLPGLHSKILYWGGDTFIHAVQYIYIPSTISLNKVFKIIRGRDHNMELGICAQFWPLPGFYFVFLSRNKVSLWIPRWPRTQ